MLQGQSIGVKPSAEADMNIAEAFSRRLMAGISSQAKPILMALVVMMSG